MKFFMLKHFKTVGMEKIASGESVGRERAEKQALGCASIYRLDIGGAAGKVIVTWLLPEVFQGGSD